MIHGCALYYVGKIPVSDHWRVVLCYYYVTEWCPLELVVNLLNLQACTGLA